VTSAARLPRAFYAVDAVTLARRLMGRHLVRLDADGSRRVGRVVEVEAYLGVNDQASHAFGGRRSPRNEAMYARPGTGYVYFTYGMHHCMNVVCGEEGVPAAVLLRALEPVEGLDHMRDQRPRARRDTDLCNGPGKLCAALSIDRALNGLDLCDHPYLFLEPGTPIAASRLARRPRVGLGDAGAWKDKRFCWYIRGHPCVSRP